jgi:hypothetical protein
MNLIEHNAQKEKPAKMGFDFFYLAHFNCWCCGVYVVMKSTYHHNMLCPDCDPDYCQEYQDD